MITLVYGPNGVDVNDFNYQEWIDDIINSDWINEDITIRVSSQIPVLLVQLAIAKKQIPHDQVEFITLENIEDGWEKPSKFNSNGQCEDGIYCFKLHDIAREFNEIVFESLGWGRKE